MGKRDSLGGGDSDWYPGKGLVESVYRYRHLILRHQQLLINRIEWSSQMFYLSLSILAVRITKKGSN